MSIKPPANPNLGPKREKVAGEGSSSRGSKFAAVDDAPNQTVRDSFQRVTDLQRKFTVRIDSDLHKRFKTAAAVEEVNMGDVVEQLIAQWLDEKGH